MSSSITASLYPAIIAGIIGSILLLPQFFRLFFVQPINVPAFSSVIQKLINASNIDRAIKLCSAAPNALITRGTKGILQGVIRGEKDPESIKRNFLEQFSPLTLDGELNKYRLLSALGFALALGGAGYTTLVQNVPPGKHLIPSAVAVFLDFIIIFRTAKMKTQIQGYIMFMSHVLSGENPVSPPKATVDPDKKVCPICEKENPEHYQFCLGCGGNLNHKKPTENVHNDRNIQGDSAADFPEKSNISTSTKKVVCKNCGSELKLEPSVLAEINSEFDIFSRIDSSCPKCNSSFFELQK